MTDKDIAKESFKEFKKQGLDIKLGSKLISARDLKGSVKIIYNNEKDIDMEFDKLIVAVGRAPNTKNIFKDDIGISMSNNFIQVNEFCQTNISNIWAIGDVVRGPMLAHKGSEEGIMVAERIANNYAKVNYSLVPSVIYSHPEVAWVGLNESELGEKGIQFKIGKFPFAAS